MSNITQNQTAAKRPDKPEVTVTYNGLDKQVEYQPQAGMNALLEHSLNAFGVHDNRHVMALWTEGGVELPIEGSAEAAGVKPGALLVLRPSAVRGGRC